FVAGWSTQTNRDTKLYILPDNITVIHEPANICSKGDRYIKHKLFLLIVVCSATENFERRMAIRDSWGNQMKYIELAKIYNKIRDNYKNYNYTYDLYIDPDGSGQQAKPGLAQMLPEVAKMLQVNLIDSKTENVPEKRFSDDDEVLIPQFDMNKELNDDTKNYEDYDTNVMKIPPRGYEDNPDLGKILDLLKKDKNLLKIRQNLEPSNTEVDFKLVFLLGLPPQKNDTDIQDRIEEEIDQFGDVIQEGFTDSYNNLTLKSIMMLKWINNNCNESANLRNRSKEHDAKQARDHTGPEYMLIGDLICGARPLLDPTNKCRSSCTRQGICAARASPRLPPRDDPSFSYSSTATTCAAHARVTSHRITSQHMLELNAALIQPAVVD
ncbi:Beta-1,3-galactosyltransferase 1, partial [Operophtera brumata]